MANIREEKRRTRLRKIKKILKAIKETGEILNKDYLIAKIMDENLISRRIAREDIEAMILIINMDERE